MSHPLRRVHIVGSDNPTGADNQQETVSSELELDDRWIVGFVDGEGCFSVSIHSNPYVRRTRGWQVHPTFQVSQHQDHRGVLEALAGFFGCGNVRRKGPNSSVMIYAVDSLRELEATIIPFFERNTLVVKDADFSKFAAIVRAIRCKQHLEAAGFERVVRLAYAMNAHGKQRARTLEEVLAGSSETARQALFCEEELKIQSDLHGDMQSQAEMTWPLSDKLRSNKQA
jgi:hypothetical protein